MLYWLGYWFSKFIPINFFGLSVNNRNSSIKYVRHYKLYFMQMSFLSFCNFLKLRKRVINYTTTNCRWNETKNLYNKIENLLIQYAMNHKAYAKPTIFCIFWLCKNFNKLGPKFFISKNIMHFLFISSYAWIKQNLSILLCIRPWILNSS